MSSAWLPSNGSELLVAVAIIGAGVVPFGLLLMLWAQRGREPLTPLTDASVLLPGPPPGITPAMAAALLREKVDDHAFYAAVMELLCRGLIDIKVSSRQPLSPSEGHDKNDLRPDIDVLVLDPSMAAPTGLPQPALGAAEQHLLAAMGTRAGSARRLSGISLRFHATFDGELETAIDDAGLGKFRDRLSSTFLGVGGLVAIILGFGLFVVVGSGVHQTPHIDPYSQFLVKPLVLSIVLGIATAALHAKVNRRTPSGAQVLAALLAYRNTLQMMGVGYVPGTLTVLYYPFSPGEKLPWDGVRDDSIVWATALGLRSDFDHFMSAAVSVSTDKIKTAEADGLSTETI